jgi:CTP:molybdopterin cytidylyltransferase MocA
MTDRTVAAIVLAAGGSTRFGREQKLTTRFRGRPLVQWAVESAVASGIGDVVVVAGADDLPLPQGVRVVVNPAWRQGQASSLHAGLAACARHDAVVVGLGDQPLVLPESWRTLARSHAPIAVATYRGRRRNPVRLAREIWPLLPRTGDAGARVLMRARPDLVTEVPCAGDSADIDTAEDLARWS